MQQQKLIFDGEECVVVSLRDISTTHELQRAKDDVALLQKLNLTISKDLIDPLNLIFFVINWLLKWYEKLEPRHKQDEVYENMIKIMIASKMSTFKCKDLLELSGASETLNSK